MNIKKSLNLKTKSPMKTTRTRLLLASALLVAAASVYGQTISSVSPTSAAQGESVLVTFTLSGNVPPAGAPPSSVTLGTISGTSVNHDSQYIVTAQFAIPAAEAVGWKDAAIVFTPPMGNSITLSKTAAFQVTVGSGVAASFTGTPTSGSVPLTVSFTDASTGTITNRLWSFGDGTTSSATHPSHTYTNTGSYTVSLTVYGTNGSNQATSAGYITVRPVLSPGNFVVVDTGQTNCYNDSVQITAPAVGQGYFGQDGQITANPPSYTLGTNGLIVYDNHTGLTWQRSPDTSGDGSITASDKLSWVNAQARPALLNATNYGGYSDWRLPTMKEIYSLMNFRGLDPSGFDGDTSLLTPFIDTNYFKFAYGETNAGERIIDSQYASSTMYVSTASGELLFGLNFADGRIKGYGLTLNGSDKKFFVQCVRGNLNYSINQFVDHGNQTITDEGTLLMWTKSDSGSGMNWSNALAWVQAKNAANYLGYSDWRLPNIKELHSIVDYTRSPDTTASAAIDPIFNCTSITNEKNVTDFPWYWSGTTHAYYDGTGVWGAYIPFGRAMGYENSTWNDVHGAGCQRSDPKGGSLSSYTYAAPNGYYNTDAPQGDAVRIDNFVRLVRTTSVNEDTVGDGISDAWRLKYFGSATTTNATSCAAGDPDTDGTSNYNEYVADTNPTNALSYFRIESITSEPSPTVSFTSSASRVYHLYYRTNLSSGSWTNVPTQTDVTGNGGTATLTDPSATDTERFYRLGVRVP